MQFLVVSKVKTPKKSKTKKPAIEDAFWREIRKVLLNGASKSNQNTFFKQFSDNIRRFRKVRTSREITNEPASYPVHCYEDESDFSVKKRLKITPKTLRDHI